MNQRNGSFAARREQIRREKRNITIFANYLWG